MGSSSRCFAAFVACAVVLLGGCGGKSGGDDPSSTGTIGAAGGAVTSRDGKLVLTVPAGALAASTQITVTEVSVTNLPTGLKTIGAERVFRLEPEGLRFAMPASIELTLPPSMTGQPTVMTLMSGDVFEHAGDQRQRRSASRRLLSGTVPHFSYLVVKEIDGISTTLESDRIETAVNGAPFLARATYTSTTALAQDMDVRGSFSTFTLVKTGQTSVGGVYLAGSYQSDEATASFACIEPGPAQFSAVIDLHVPASDTVIPGLWNSQLYRDEIELAVTCTGAAGSIVNLGLYPSYDVPLPEDFRIIYNEPPRSAALASSAGANPLFAGLSGAGPWGVLAGGTGVKIVDLVTRQVLLDRTSTGPNGATLGSNRFGAVPVAHAASAGAPAAIVGFGPEGAFVQNYDATNGWGGTFRDAEPTFDVVTAGGGTVSDVVVLVRPVRGIDVVSFDATAMAYRTDPRFALLSAFPGGGQLVSAQMPDAASGGVLVLSRATSASVSVSSKVFFKNVDDTQPATTLLSWGNVDTRRLRCLPVGTKQACVATLFGGEGRAFLFDPASPRDTPRVIVLTAAAGTLGVALTALPNGHIGAVMANFTASSLTVAELSADLLTIHSLNTTPAPAGCTGTAHPALLSDSEGIKAIVTCNGTSNYWVVKPFS